MRVENDVAYEQKYSGSEVEIVDKVKRIYHYGSEAAIETKHGWNVLLDADWPSLADLRKGTLIKVTGELGDVSWIRAHTIVIIEENSFSVIFNSDDKVLISYIECFVNR